GAQAGQGDAGSAVTPGHHEALVAHLLGELDLLELPHVPPVALLRNVKAALVLEGVEGGAAQVAVSSGHRLQLQESPGDARGAVREACQRLRGESRGRAPAGAARHGLNMREEVLAA